jgi:sulfur carrier protein
VPQRDARGRVLASAAMRIHVNGEPRDVADDTSVRALIEALGLGAVPVAVERNKDIVPRALHETTALREGDELEVVHFVGGG